MRFYHLYDDIDQSGSTGARDGNEADVVSVQMLSARLGGLSQYQRAKSSAFHCHL